MVNYWKHEGGGVISDSNDNYIGTFNGDFKNRDHLICAVNNEPQLRARIAELEQLAERLKQEAQIHAMEARTANATIAEIYQCVSGATGEPGNWNGAEPVRNRIAELEQLAKEMAEIVTRYRNETPLGHQPHMICHIADEAIFHYREVCGGEK